MAEYLVPASILMGQESGESPGLDTLAITPDPVPVAPYTHATVSLFSDDTIVVDGLSDSTKQSPVALGNTLKQINARGGGRFFVGDTASGRVEIPGATYAGPNAAGVVLCRPEDIGIGAQQIPADKTQLTNVKLSYYPIAFVRKGQRVRTIFSQQGGTELAPVNSGNPNVGAFPAVVGSVPGYSQWTCLVDGTAIQLGFQHPVGSDYRRGRDIWEHVIMPMVVNANNNKGQVLTFDPLISPVIRGVVTRMSYLAYARLDALYDTGGGPIFPQPVYPPA